MIDIFVYICLTGDSVIDKLRRSEERRKGRIGKRRGEERSGEERREYWKMHL